MLVCGWQCVSAHQLEKAQNIDVIFFDESILAKANRNKFRFSKHQTPFLDSTDGAITRTTVTPHVYDKNLPTDRTYSYTPHFPPLDWSLYYAPRYPNSLVDDDPTLKANSKRRHKIPGISWALAEQDPTRFMTMDKASSVYTAWFISFVAKFNGSGQATDATTKPTTGKGLGKRRWSGLGSPIAPQARHTQSVMSPVKVDHATIQETTPGRPPSPPPNASTSGLAGETVSVGDNLHQQPVSPPPAPHTNGDALGSPHRGSVSPAGGRVGQIRSASTTELVHSPTTGSDASMTLAQYREMELQTAFAVLRRMQVEGVEPAEAVYRCLLEACGRVGDVMQASLVLKEVVRANMQMDSSIYSCLLGAFAMDSSVAAASSTFRNIFKDMHERSHSSIQLPARGLFDKLKNMVAGGGAGSRRPVSVPQLTSSTAALSRVSNNSVDAESPAQWARSQRRLLGIAAPNHAVQRSVYRADSRSRMESQDEPGKANGHGDTDHSATRLSLTATLDAMSGPRPTRPSPLAAQCSLKSSPTSSEGAATAKVPTPELPDSSPPPPSPPALSGAQIRGTAHPDQSTVAPLAEPAVAPGQGQDSGRKQGVEQTTGVDAHDGMPPPPLPPGAGAAESPSAAAEHEVTDGGNPPTLIASPPQTAVETIQPRSAVADNNEVSAFAGAKGTVGAGGGSSTQLVDKAMVRTLNDQPHVPHSDAAAASAQPLRPISMPARATTGGGGNRYAQRGPIRASHDIDVTPTASAESGAEDGTANTERKPQPLNGGSRRFSLRSLLGRRDSKSNTAAMQAASTAQESPHAGATGSGAATEAMPVPDQDVQGVNFAGGGSTDPSPRSSPVSQVSTPAITTPTGTPQRGSAVTTPVALAAWDKSSRADSDVSSIATAGSTTALSSAPDIGEAMIANQIGFSERERQLSVMARGYGLLGTAFPDLEINLTEECESCKKELTATEIQSGWTTDLNDYTTVCPYCKAEYEAHSHSAKQSRTQAAAEVNGGEAAHTPPRRFVARFYVFSSAEWWEGSAGPHSKLYCEYLPPWTMLKELISAVAKYGT